MRGARKAIEHMCFRRRRREALCYGRAVHFHGESLHVHVVVILFAVEHLATMVHLPGFAGHKEEMGRLVTVSILALHNGDGEQQQGSASHYQACTDEQPTGCVFTHYKCIRAAILTGLPSLSYKTVTLDRKLPGSPTRLEVAAHCEKEQIKDDVLLVYISTCEVEMEGASSSKVAEQ
jgi:hypothetical protein